MGWIVVDAVFALVFVAAILAIMLAGIRWEARLAQERETEARRLARYLAWREAQWPDHAPPFVTEPEEPARRRPAPERVHS